MQLVERVEGPQSAAAVVDVLHDMPGWKAWIPGALRVSTTPGPGPNRQVHLLLRAPREVSLTLDVRPTPDGIRFGLVEGDLSAIAGEVTVEDRDTGCAVNWRMALAFPLTLPGPLVRELEREVLPRWIGALLLAATRH